MGISSSAASNSDVLAGAHLAGAGVKSDAAKDVTESFMCFT